MTLQDLGALGEVVGGFAVVVSLVYVAYQIRQSSRQIELNSRHVRAAMYHATNDSFFRWFSLLAQDQEVADLWLRGFRGETLSPDERVRYHALVSMLFFAYEGNFEQLKLGTIQRDTLRIAGPDIARLLGRPAVKSWWERQAPTSLTPEFREAIAVLVAEHQAAPGGAEGPGAVGGRPGEAGQEGIGP